VGKRNRFGLGGKGKKERDERKVSHQAVRGGKERGGGGEAILEGNKRRVSRNKRKEYNHGFSPGRKEGHAKFMF